jgi:hypothetical protein
VLQLDWAGLGVVGLHWPEKEESSSSGKAEGGDL